MSGLQSSNENDAEDAQSLLERQVEPPYHRNRQDEDAYIDDDICCSYAQIIWHSLNTMPAVFVLKLSSNCGNWHALNDGNKNESN